MRLQAFGVTEPTSGTDTLALRTTAVRDGNDSYVINGQKIWTSRAEHSDLMLLLARTTPRDQVKKRTEGLSVFLVEMKAAGESLKINPIRTMMNHATTEIFMDDLRVPAENLVGEEGMGFRYILSGMNAERILIAAECIGDAKWFIEKASDYAKERSVFGRPIGQNQGIQFPIARAYAQMRAAELMVHEAASLYEQGKDCGAEANMAKMLAADASWAAADMCVQTHGGFGFAEEFDIERKFRETRLYSVAPISTNLVLSYLAAMQRTRPPFRADHVGSFLRTAAIKDARAKREAGQITAEQLRAVEDAEIKKIIAKQEECGLQARDRRRIPPLLVALRFPLRARRRRDEADRARHPVRRRADQGGAARHRRQDRLLEPPDDRALQVPRRRTRASRRR